MYFEEEKINAKKVLKSFLKVFGLKLTILLFPESIATKVRNKKSQKELDDHFY